MNCRIIGIFIAFKTKLKRSFSFLLSALLIFIICHMLRSSYIKLYAAHNIQLLRVSNENNVRTDMADGPSNVVSNSSLPVLLNLTRETRVDKEILDIMGLPPIKFDRTYKNPCFKGDKTSELFSDGQLHCLPYFYIIGVKKSGTSDLFRRISAHPEFQDPGFKEAQWFPRVRFGEGRIVFSKNPIYKKSRRKGIDNRGVKYYISLFDTAAAKIRNCSKHGGVHQYCITAEATPGNLHMHRNWDLLPGNEGLTEPRYTNFHYIKHLTPDAKIIIIFRDPVTRLFSDFLHEKKHRKLEISNEKVAEMFHTQLSELTRSFEECFKRYSMRRCLYDETLTNELEEEGHFMAQSFRASYHAFYIEELFSVFRRDQILAVKMKHYITHMEDTLNTTFQFLEMSPLSKKKMSEIGTMGVPNSSKYETTMNKETKTMLYNYYRPYNEKMAKIMHDSDYLFTES